MTYPKARYHGSTGEVSARLRPGTNEPDLVRTSGTEVHYLATGASTGGLFGLYRWSMGPAQGGAEPHFHRTISESFYILSGSVRVYNGKEWLNAEVGDFMHVPPGGIHAFSNESDAAASMLIHFAPGAPRESYFENLNRLGEMSEFEREAFFVAHDNHYLK
ncbi:MAG: cupin domain-containing protein [Acidimicrobiia bacterium]|nr:cupin domain-containing protein [Acidimicrobiia bacterium]